VGVLFLAPGLRETLRVNGKAKVVRDNALMEQMAVNVKQPVADFPLLGRILLDQT